jgi:ribosome-associated protein
VPIQGIELAKACAHIADDLKAEQVKIYDMRSVSGITDFMVICTGNSMPQLRAVLRDMSAILEQEHGVKPVYSEGRADTRWVVLDYIDVMVHVMDPELRDFYALEDLWKDASELPWL